MALFRKKSPQIVRKSSTEGTVEEHKTVRAKGKKVEVTRVEARPPPPRNRRRIDVTSRPARAAAITPGTEYPHPVPGPAGPVDDEVIVPVETGRKQMLVRVHRGQTQMVILEGPVLVEHYVAREDAGSVAGNIYWPRFETLPGMEAAFLDFGASRMVCCTHRTSPPMGRAMVAPTAESRTSSRRAMMSWFR